VQLRFRTQLTSEQYVKQQGWLLATLEHCPLHPEGGCGLERLGTYGRVEPPGAKVARYYCSTGHVTFSLLPDCLAARLSSTLAEVEQVVTEVEEDAKAQVPFETTAQRLRPDVGLSGAVRWVRRRRHGVRAALVIAVGLLPSVFAGTTPTIEGFRDRFGVAAVLPEVRARIEAHLVRLPPPVGFRPGKIRPQETGADLGGPSS
jgi:hypothetical protein